MTTSGASNREWNPRTDSPVLEAYVRSETTTMGALAPTVSTRYDLLTGLNRVTTPRSELERLDREAPGFRERSERLVDSGEVTIPEDDA